MTTEELMGALAQAQADQPTRWFGTRGGRLRCVHRGKKCCPLTFLFASRNPEFAVPGIGEYLQVGKRLGINEGMVKDVVRAADGMAANQDLRRHLVQALVAG